MAPLVSLRDVTVRFGNVPVVSSASCTLEAGEVLAIQGPNGAGKTTLLRVMATLLHPTEGKGQVLGAELGTREVDQVRPRIGLSGHLPALSGNLTLAENLEFVARVGGRPLRRVAEVLELVGLAGAADRPANRCSHGMRKRADLARLFLTEPELLLLDEPHAGLDSSAFPLVFGLVSVTRRKGGGAVLVSHDPTTLLDLADQQMSIVSGTLIPL